MDGRSACGSSELQRLREGGHVAVAIRLDDDEVFDSHATQPGVVETRFHGEGLAGGQHIGSTAERGGLMDLEPHPVPCAVEVSLHAPVDFAGAITGVGEGFLNILVNGGTIGTGTNRLQRLQLCRQHRVVQSLNVFGNLTTYESARNVPEVSARIGPRKDVDDDG